jgi:hypothetical protein
MKGLQRTCAPARYTRLIVLPRFLCVWLRNSRTPFPLKTHTKSATYPKLPDMDFR